MDHDLRNRSATEGTRNLFHHSFAISITAPAKLQGPCTIALALGIANETMGVSLRRSSLLS